MRYLAIGMVLLTACAGAQRPLASAPMTRMTFVGAEGSRAFLTYRPATFPARAADRALVVMLHGCTQDGEDMARGTRMNASAEAAGFMVLYPEQPASAHVQKCWNWYDPAQTTRGRGEAAILSGLIDSVAKASGIAPRRVALVGMSVCGARAALRPSCAGGEGHDDGAGGDAGRGRRWRRTGNLRTRGNGRVCAPHPRVCAARCH